MSFPRQNLMRVPRVDTLRVRPKVSKDPDPCVAAMSTVLSCWASVGFNAAGCGAVEDQLRKCMDNRVTMETKATSLNYHLRRFQKRLEGGTNGRRYKGSKD